MQTLKDNFNLWFRKSIESLYGNENAGFPILMLVLPLLERYLRSKSGVPEGEKLTPAFFNELVALFPSLKDETLARNFWQVYRNGILHQATLSRKNSRGTMMPDGWLSGNDKIKDFEIDSNGHFWVNPVKFAKKVIDTINNDFSNYEASGSHAHNLATAQTSPIGLSGTSGYGRLIP